MPRRKAGLENVVQQTTLVALAPEIAAAFPTPEAVTNALRELLREHEARERSRPKARRSKKR